MGKRRKKNKTPKDFEASTEGWGVGEEERREFIVVKKKIKKKSKGCHIFLEYKVYGGNAKLGKKCVSSEGAGRYREIGRLIFLSPSSERHK